MSQRAGTGTNPGRAGRPRLGEVLGADPGPKETQELPPGTTRVPLWVGLVILVGMIQFTLGPVFAATAGVVSALAVFGSGYGWFATVPARRPHGGGWG